MANLKRVGPGSAFKIGLIVYGLLGMILGACFSLAAILGTGIAVPGGPAGMFVGVGAIIIFPIIYGLAGGICNAIGAVIYNLAAGWVGGLEVDIS